MKIAEIEFEHPDNQFTIDAIRNKFISVINDKCPDVLLELKFKCLIKFLKTGIHKIHNKIEKSKQEWNSNLMLQFLEYYKKVWIVCQFDVIHNISSEDIGEHVCVSLSSSQHFLHPVCKKWAKKLSAHYYQKHPEHRKLYVMDIVKYYPPCPWMYIFWTSTASWAETFNLIEIDDENKWLFESAIYTIDFWSKNPSQINEVGLLESSLYRKENLKTLEPPSGLPKWEPQYEEKETYLSKVKALVKKSLIEQDIFQNNKLLNVTLRNVLNFVETYCNRVEKHFRSNGWKKVKVKKEFEKHLEWTVRFQVKEESYSKIARDYNVYASSVKKEVEEILNTIGLRKREIRRGRLKGQKTSETATILKSLGK
jgi:hypothetical protein